MKIQTRLSDLKLQRSLCVLLFALPLVATAEEVVNPPSASQLKATIGYSSMSDTSVPGQAISQQDLPLGVSIESDRYVFEVSIPYIQRSAPLGKVAKSHHHESKKDSATIAPIIATAGLGDITSSLEYVVLDEKTSPLSLSAKGEIKLATADLATGLGTGVNDYFFELAAGKSMGDFSGKAVVGRAILGSPGKVKINEVTKYIYFNNIYYGSVEADYQFSDTFSSSLSYALGQASETGGPQQRDLTLGVEYKFSEKQSLSVGATRSLSPGITSQGLAASYSIAM